MFEKVDSHYLLKGTSEEIAQTLSNEVPLVIFDELNHLPDRLAGIGVKETTGLTEYKKILVDSSAVEHFPKSIQDDPARYKLSHQPPFLQGGGWFHLEEQVTVKEASVLHDRMMEEALAYKDIGAAGLTNLQSKVDPDTPGISYHTSDTEYSLPKGFSIFYIHAKPYRDEGFKWNHGSITGIAIKKDDGRVIYFLEDW